MPLLSDPIFLALALIGVCLLGLSKSGFFGLGVIALPLVSLVLPPMQVAAIFLPVALASDVVTVWTYRRHWSAWNLRVLIPSTVIGVIAGWWLAAVMTGAHIRFAVGVIAAAFVIRQWSGQRLARLMPEPNLATGVIFGAIGGFTTMLANAGGPAWQIHLLPQKMDKLTYVGTVTILFAAGNWIKIPALWNLGVLTGENLLVGACLVPAAIAANYAGIWLVRRISTEQFFRVAYVLMFLIAVELIRGSAFELWR